MPACLSVSLCVPIRVSGLSMCVCVLGARSPRAPHLPICSLKPSHVSTNARQRLDPEARLMGV